MDILSQKEKEIFEGILKLAQNGENIFTLKVQQIADAAKIGKGTLYEYFSSREEILAKALIYSMDSQMTLFSDAVENKPNFEKKLEVALDFAHQSVSDNSAGAIFTNAMRDASLREKLLCFCDKREEFLQRLYSVLLKIVEVGRKEGKVCEVENSYCLMTMVSVLCTVMFTSSQGGFDTWENIRHNALKMLCKALA